MKKSQIAKLGPGSAEKVIAHAKCRGGKKHLSMFYKDERNPRKALILAKLEKRGRGILKKYPETEKEYWATIEALGGEIWFLSHEIGHGRIEGTAETIAYIENMRQISSELANELDRFGVILQKDYPKVADGEKPVAPKGKILYWDWYYKMKKRFYAPEYEKLICSACPLSKGVEEFIARNQIPCSEFCGSIYKLSQPFICGMMSTSYAWSRKKLLAKIRKVGGIEASARFRAKEEKLKKIAAAKEKRKKAAA